MIKDKISIIGSARNEGDYLKQSLDHIVKETDYPLFEIILINDGSTDHSFQQIDPGSYNIPVKILHNKETIGVAKSRNLGAKEADGEYLVFMDCHIFPSKNWLRELVEAVHFEEGGMSVVKIANLQSNEVIAEETNFNYIFNDYSLYPQWQYENQKNIYEVPLAYGCSQLIRREIFDRVRGYNEEFLGVGREDSELSLKNCLLGYKIYSNPHATVKHYFKTTWENRFQIYYNIIYNTLAFGFLHFSEVNFLKMINTVKTYSCFAAAFYSVVNNDKIKILRNYYKSHFKYDDLWFFNKFAKNFELMNTNYRNFYKDQISTVLNQILSKLFSDNPQNQIFDIDPFIQDFKKETFLSNEDIKVLVQEKLKKSS